MCAECRHWGTRACVPECYMLDAWCTGEIVAISGMTHVIVIYFGTAIWNVLRCCAHTHIVLWTLKRRLCVKCARHASMRRRRQRRRSLDHRARWSHAMQVAHSNRIGSIHSFSFLWFEKNSKEMLIGPIWIAEAQCQQIVMDEVVLQLLDTRRVNDTMKWLDWNGLSIGIGRRDWR